jgi:hypothetical protein
MYEPPPEIIALIEMDRQKHAASVARIWQNGLSHKDWLFDGHPIRGRIMIARFNNLDWSKAWVDLGPSIAGNPGPYWHVPLRETWIDGELYDDGETIHRLYPKVLQSKWAMLILHACYEVERNAGRHVGVALPK